MQTNDYAEACADSLICLCASARPHSGQARPIRANFTFFGPANSSNSPETSKLAKASLVEKNRLADFGSGSCHNLVRRRHDAIDTSEQVYSDPVWVPYNQQKRLHTGSAASKSCSHQFWPKKPLAKQTDAKVIGIVRPICFVQTAVLK
ncbi:unnamed protein product [Protopolystoma xenopodis]|uniref:Uncharacterized protein n=1 Tax=Protopolystoma xenopodis TaxID=117903 RepID=A0A448XN63_9PLAT|nr:unnamed protein product [Protopolystoma xenopodis]